MEKLPSYELTLVIFIDCCLDLGRTFSLVTLPVGTLDATSDSVELFCGLTKESALPALAFLCALLLNLTRSILVWDSLMPLTMGVVDLRSLPLRPEIPMVPPSERLTGDYGGRASFRAFGLIALRP